MDQLFTGLGLRFRYPEDWELSEELGEDEACITVNSPSTAFWSVTVIRERPEPLDVIRAVVQAYEEEYDELDLIESEVEVAMRQVQAIEIDFVCLELTNTAHVRAFQTDVSTILVLYQLNDNELDSLEPVLDQITSSLICDTDISPLQ